jgi:SprA-related family
MATTITDAYGPSRKVTSPSVGYPGRESSLRKDISSEKSADVGSAKARDEAQFSTTALNAVAREEEQTRIEKSSSVQRVEPSKTGANEKEPKQEAKNQITGQELTPEELRAVAELQLRDREVRSHESAHQAAGGGFVGAASYTYQRGPDGKSYAIGGEVPVSMNTAGSSPSDVVRQMEQVRAAALAPADPSSQDLAVAAAASAMAAQARNELTQENREAVNRTEQKRDNDKRAGTSSEPSAQATGQNASAQQTQSPQQTQVQQQAIAAYQTSMAQVGGGFNVSA